LKKVILVLFIALAAAAFYFVYTPSTPDYGRKILVFSKTVGERHESIGKGVEMLAALGREGEFNVVASEDSALFTQESLGQFDTVVFLNTTGDVLDLEQQDAFERYIQAGGGFVGIHAAANTGLGDSPWHWYQRLVGGVFDRYPDNSDQQTTINVTDTPHPATNELPGSWQVADAWYQFRQLSDGINVLLTIEGVSAAGEKMTTGHPIAWYRDFDGGRSFYLGLGHGEAVYDDRQFQRLLLGGIEYTMGDGALDYSRAKPESWRFSRVQLDSGLDEPIKIAFSPAGGLYYIQRKGELMRYDFDQKRSITVAKLPVYTQEEYGLLGLAFDPDFNNTHWLYLYYVIPEGDAGRSVLARFDLKGDELDLASQVELLSSPVTGYAQKGTSHTGGDMQFDAKGNLWLSTGDDTAADKHGYIDDRPDRENFDAARSAANTQDLRGKILRIRPRETKNANGLWYDIPAGNLFEDTAQGRPEIYAMGLRNPYTLAYDNRTDTLYWGEVGPDGHEDGPRGPMGYDEINRTRQPGNFGWPYVIADNRPYAYYDYENEQVLDEVNPLAPENRSANNTGLRILPPAQPAWIYYPYGESETFFELESGGRNALVTIPYYSEDYADSAVKFPAWLDGKLVISDFIRRWIKVINLDPMGNLESITPLIHHRFSAPLDMAFGPDGALYVVEYGSNWFQQNPDAYLSRIEYYDGENPPPVAVARVANAVGAAPLETVVDATGSYDRGVSDDALRYQWELESADGTRRQLGSLKIQPLNIASAGEYRVRLTVSDEEGLSDTTELKLVVGNEPPVVHLDVKGNKSFYWHNQQLEYEVSVTDLEDGTTVDGGIPMDDVDVRFEYLGPSADLAAEVAHYDADPVIVGRELVASGSDCHACHQVDEDSIGPSFTAIAKRYAIQGDAAQYLQKVISEGAAGQWGGTHAMPGHPDLDEAALRAASSYILSLAGERGRLSGLALSGEVQFDRHLQDAIEAVVRVVGEISLGEFHPGEYLLHAGYTDRGGDAPTLRGSQALVFHHSKQMADFMEPGPGAGVLKIPDDVQVMPIVSPGPGADFSYGRMPQIDLTGISTIEVRAEAVSSIFEGGILQLRLDDPGSPAVASVPVETYLLPGKDKGMVRLDVAKIDGVHDLFLGALHGPDDDNKPKFMIITVEFIGASSQQ
jgi:cytochrome c